MYVCACATRRHHVRDDYLYFVDDYWFIGTNVGQKAGLLFVHDGAWRPEHVLDTWEVWSVTHFEFDSGLTVRCQGLLYWTIDHQRQTCIKYLVLKYKYKYKYPSLKYEYKYKYLVFTTSTHQVCNC